MKRATGVLAVLMILTTASCSGDTPEENAGQACAAADDLSAALENLGTTLTPDATIDEIRAAGDRVDEAQDALDAAADDVAADRTDALDEAWDRLEQGIDDLGGDQTIAEAAGSLRDDVGELRDAREALVADLGC